jgi:hypothetical protein
VDRSLVFDIAGVESLDGLEQENMSLFVGNGAVLHPSGHNQELPLLEPDVPVAELHAEAAMEDEEQLVLGFVLVPEELAQELDELDLLAVEFPDDPGTPVVVEELELLPDVHLVQGLVSLGDLGSDLWFAEVPIRGDERPWPVIAPEGPAVRSAAEVQGPCWYTRI